MHPPEAPTLAALQAQVADLRARLKEAEALGSAIRSGAVDAFVIGQPDRERVYELVSDEHPYRLLVEAMQEGAVTVTPEGAILYANPSFCRLIGYSLPELTGASFLRFVPDEERAGLATLIEASQRFKREMHLLGAGDAAPPVYVSGGPADLSGLKGCCLVVTDLSPQKRLDEIAASERLTRLILEQAGEIIIVCDPDGQITHASRRATEVFGVSPILYAIERLLPGACEAEDQAVDFRFVTPSGAVQYFQINCAPLSADERLLGKVYVFTDITERRAAAVAAIENERLLRELNESLEQRVSARTEELHAMNQTLVDKNRELRDFTYAASHDLQEPLRKITSFCELLRRDYSAEIPPLGLEYLDRTQRAAIRMSDLLHALLSYSRVGTHGQPFTHVSLADVARDSLTDLEIALEESAAKVEIGALPVIEADALQMRQLFQNIIGNALKFRRPSQPAEVRVSGYLSDAHGRPLAEAASHCCLEIADEGIGFDVKYADRIFSPFQRLHGRSSYPGAGMGLAICRRIVERHGGIITAVSAPGEGARFCVLLPVQRQTPAGAPA